MSWRISVSREPLAWAPYGLLPLLRRPAHGCRLLPRLRRGRWPDAPAPPITARQVGAQLEEARHSLPYGSIQIAGAGFAGVATVLSLTSCGARPSWLLTILTLAGIGTVTAGDLLRRGAFQLDAWPLGEWQETALAATTPVLLAATSLVSLHALLGSMMWLLALAFLGWGAWPVLRPYVDLAPSRLLGG